MRKFIFIILIIESIFAIWMAINLSSPSLDVTLEYSQGKITTQVKEKRIKNIASTEIRYITYFLDQYINVDPRVETYSFENIKRTHTFEVHADLLQGKKDYLEVEVVITYDEGMCEVVDNATIHDIKPKVYHDFVIEPDMNDDTVCYRTNGLTAIISKDSYDEEIIFYTEPNSESPNIALGFQKDYALYPLKFFGVISKKEALERNFEGMSPFDFTRDSGVDESYIVVEYGMIELSWDGLYPYDADGNKVFYEGETDCGGINLVKDNQIVEISRVSHEKYNQMLNTIPNIIFEIPRE